jgi:hypothetical protein
MYFWAVFDIVPWTISFHHETVLFIGHLTRLSAAISLLLWLWLRRKIGDLNRRAVGYVCAVS